ncbi:MAG: right-handed parallel beta-helix repeat-containing protein [Candidatus Paceibacterota bacterium]|jgi:parallel beta-helix repeat protein
MSKEPKEYIKLGGAILLMVVAVVFLTMSIGSNLRSGCSGCQIASVGSLGSGATYYVDNQAGNDINTGTSIDKPWKTVAKVNVTAFNAGDQILFKKGGVWNETLTPSSSGSSGQPIIFDAYGDGNLPEFNGNGTLTSTLRLDSKNYLTFVNLAFTNSKISEEGSIYMLYGQGIKLQNLVVKNNGGVGIGGLATNNLTISQSEIYNNNRQGIYLAYTTGALVEGNKVYSNSQRKDDSFGIDIIVPTGSNVVRYNTVHDQAVITDPSLYVCGAAKCGNGGIRFDGDGTGSNNTERLGNVAYRNLIYNEDQGVQLVNYSGAEIFNNTVYNTRQYGILAMAQPGYGINSKNKIQNNIVQTNSTILANLNGAGNTIDFNVYYPAGSNSFIWTSNVNWNPGALSLINFTNWKTTSGLDTHSLNADPKFVGAPGNFDLSSASPAVNAGTSLGTGNDLLNRAIVGVTDIGAYEYQGTVTLPPTCIENWIISTWTPSPCAGGNQTRIVTDSNNCGTVVNKPATTTTQVCATTPPPACTPNWTTGAWTPTVCTTGTQTRTVADSNNCGLDAGKPATSQTCTVAPTCSNSYCSSKYGRSYVCKTSSSQCCRKTTFFGKIYYNSCRSL